MKINIKPATIARIGALLVVLINQCLVMFGHDILPFTEHMTYQVVSLIATIVIAALNAWYNNDISRIALICGEVFNALEDGKITEQEIEKMLVTSEDAEKIEEKKTNFFVALINKFIASIKAKFRKE